MVTHKIAGHDMAVKMDMFWDEERQGAPPLMNLTCADTETTRLPSGRPSISLRRLRSYSDAGMPGVSSWLFTRRDGRHSTQPLVSHDAAEWDSRTCGWLWNVGWPNLEGLGTGRGCASVAYVLGVQGRGARRREEGESGLEGLRAERVSARADMARARLRLRGRCPAGQGTRALARTS